MTDEGVIVVNQPRQIQITQSRWSVKITIIADDGTEQTYIASADGYYTEHSSIWFGTEEEYADA